MKPVINKSNLTADLSGACVGALATLPQAVAYGLIATSPLGVDWAVFGIMASVGSAIFFGLLTGALSSNRFLVSGPRAVTAMVFATAISEALRRGLGSEMSVTIAMIGVVAGGLFQTVFGILRLGRVVSYIPMPVLGGFVTASALLVFINAIPMALGVPNLEFFDLFSPSIQNISVWAILVSGLTIIINFTAGKWIKFLPAALIALCVGTVMYHIGVFGFQMSQGPMVGLISLTQIFQVPLIIDLAPAASLLIKHSDIIVLAGTTLSLLNSFDTVLSASALSAFSSDQNKPNRDLAVHGLCNALMGLCGFLPGSGTLSRSMAVIKAGAKTRVTNVSAAIVFALLLALLAPVVAQLPLWATSGMLIATAIQAIDSDTLSKTKIIFQKSLPFKRVLAGDVLVTLGVVSVAIVIDLIAAVCIGIVLAVLLFVLGMGRNPIRRSYSGARIHSKTQRRPEHTAILDTHGGCIHVIELQGALFFGTSSTLEENVKAVMREGANYIILNIRYLTSIDSTGSKAIRDLARFCRDQGGQLVISCLEPERRYKSSQFLGRSESYRDRRELKSFNPRWIWLTMDANGVQTELEPNSIFGDMDTALAYCEEFVISKFDQRDQARKRVIQSDVFSGFTRTDLLYLAPFVKRHLFKPGQVVFSQNSSSQDAYFVVSGSLDVLLDIPGSERKRRVSTLTQGVVFGEMGLLDKGRRSATIMAREVSPCFSISPDNFKKFEKTHPHLALLIMRNMNVQFSNRLRVANMMISELEQ